MVRSLSIVCLLAVLQACAGSRPAAVAAAWDEAPAGQYRFDWQLSGDPAVAPLQVFDDARRIWLQFAPGQPIPAIFAHGAGGERPVPYLRRDPYIVVDGAWPALSLRAAAISRRMAQRRAAGRRARRPSAPRRRPRPRQPPSRPPPPRFRAAPPDLTLRAVLARWARAAGWTFEAEHWALDVDIPLAGKAELPGDFKTAVRALLAATELSERPAQPCFYANRVLRVVPLAQACDRTRAAAPGLT
ncbi:toxin co-regulated pilus biosynthesis protein Q [Bordetella pertussis STO1-CHOC-0018]|nr:toxin co-regulated pilus biosynthesis protein Q [Bordetella pertussis STO1-CHOC-0018]